MDIKKPVLAGIVAGSMIVGGLAKTIFDHYVPHGSSEVCAVAYDPKKDAAVVTLQRHVKFLNSERGYNRWVHMSLDRVTDSGIKVYTTKTEEPWSLSFRAD